MSSRWYLGLGSNLGDSPGYIRLAIRDLASAGDVAAQSDLYVTPPWGRIDQPPFYNAAVALDAPLDARALLTAAKAIEARLGRTKGERWGPRIIDIDVLAGDALDQVSQAEPVVPHPRLRERAFALVPLAEVAPDLELAPDGKTVAALVAALPREQREPIIRLHGSGVLPRRTDVDYDEPGGAAESYDELRPFNSVDVVAFGAVAQRIGLLPGMRIADVGCGTGRFTERFAAAGADVTGVDRSARMLDRARQRAPHHAMRFVHGDACRDIPGGPYDAIATFFAVQHFADIDAFLRAAKRALTPGGTLAIATFTHRHFTENVLARVFPSFLGIELARFPSAPALERALRSAGFSDVAATAVPVVWEMRANDFLERVAAKYISTLHVIGDDEFRMGVAALGARLAGAGTVSRCADAVVVGGRAQGRNTAFDEASPIQ